MAERSADAYSMLARSKKGIDGFVERDTDVLVDGSPVREALDAEGLPLLLLPLVDPPVLRFDASGRGLSVTSADHELIIRCLDHRPTTQFSYLVDDMLREVADDPAPTIATYTRVLDNWRSLFTSVNSPLLSVPQQIGLMAELHVLESALNVDLAAIRRWSGPRGGRHDFQGDDASVEVKSTMKHHDFAVVIHGFWQLEPPEGSSLALYAERVEQTASATGESLPGVVARIHDVLLDHAEFSQLLAAAGYDESKLEVYANFRFEILERRLFAVDREFPRLAPKEIGEGVTALIPEVQYSVNVGAVPALATGAEALRAAGMMVMIGHA